MAEFERALIQERVCSGLRNARASGKQLGRPRRIVDRDRVVRMKAEGLSLRDIAAKLGVGYGTVRLQLGQALQRLLIGAVIAPGAQEQNA